MFKDAGTVEVLEKQPINYKHEIVCKDKVFSHVRVIHFVTHFRKATLPVTLSQDKHWCQSFCYYMVVNRDFEIAIYLWVSVKHKNLQLRQGVFECKRSWLRHGYSNTVVVFDILSRVYLLYAD